MVLPTIRCKNCYAMLDIVLCNRSFFFFFFELYLPSDFLFQRFLNARCYLSFMKTIIIIMFNWLHMRYSPSETV